MGSAKLQKTSFTAPTPLPRDVAILTELEGKRCGILPCVTKVLIKLIFAIGRNEPEITQNY